MEFDFLKPLDGEIVNFIRSLSSQSLGNKVHFYTKDNFPKLEKVSIAIIGVLESRGLGTEAEKVDLVHFRKCFYKLFPGNWDKVIVDLGDINQGDALTDTYYALEVIVAKLIKSAIIPLIIGGTQDLTYAMYRSYDKLKRMVNLVSIDSRFDIVKEKNTKFSSSYLMKIIIDEPNNLFNYSNIGYQSYYNSQEEIDLVERLFFDTYRLGEITDNITIAEPVFRDADLISLDLSAIKSSDSGNFVNFVPNGFTGKEICLLSRYAGISDKISSFGIFNHSSSKLEASLMSQIVWYFIEGFHYRSNEYPIVGTEDCISYIVPFQEKELKFFKSNKTDRWWIEMPFISSKSNKSKKNALLPCTYEDYLSVCNQELPDRLWKTQRKYFK